MQTLCRAAAAAALQTQGAAPLSAIGPGQQCPVVCCVCACVVLCVCVCCVVCVCVLCIRTRMRLNANMYSPTCILVSAKLVGLDRPTCRMAIFASTSSLMCSGSYGYAATHTDGGSTLSLVARRVGRRCQSSSHRYGIKMDRRRRPDSATVYSTLRTVTRRLAYFSSVNTGCVCAEVCVRVLWRQEWIGDGGGGWTRW